MMTNALTLSPYSYNTYGVPGKYSVPVTPSAVIYAQFKNISGVAANPGQRGVPVTKIRILNSLINDLNTLRNKEREDASSMELPEQDTDTLIDKLHAELIRTMRNEPEATFMLSGAQPMTGEIINIIA